MNQGASIREAAHKLVDTLPEDATWEDLARLAFEMQRVEEGIADLDAGRYWSSGEIRERLGILNEGHMV